MTGVQTWLFRSFDAEKDLEKIGVVNQTTMLASDTQSIADFLRKVMIEKYQLSEENVSQRFADTRDTLCYATNENQQATYGLLKQPADLAIVVGGYNSSNTTHLVEIGEQQASMARSIQAGNIQAESLTRAL